MKNNNLKNILELYDIFKKIENYGYIKCELKGNGSAGNVFEILIGKKRDSKSLPDFKNIEIKTHLSTTNYPIDLLSIFPKTNKSNSEKALINFINVCGHYGIKNKRSKYFNDKIYLNEIKYHYNYFIKSYISYNNEEIIVKSLNYNFILIEKLTWPIKDIYEKFKNKLDYLALVSVNKKMNNKNTYYKFSKIDFFKFKGFNYLIKALIEKKIYISFNLELKIKGEEKWVKYHGISFVIKKENIKYIYDDIYIWIN